MTVRLLAATALALFLVGIALGHVTARASRATVIPASSFHDVVGHPQESRNPWPTTLGPFMLEPQDADRPAGVHPVACDGLWETLGRWTNPRQAGHRPEGSCGSSAFAPSILEPDLTTPVSRASVEQPAAAPLTVSKAPKRSVGTASVTGIASYYDWRPGEAAACAPLRAALGAGWRDRVVSVNGIAVRLTDYCPQTGRLIDLDSRTFALLAPLSQGLVRVRVTW